MGGGSGGGSSYGNQPLLGGGFNQSQQNYINKTGKLPGGFGGGALSGAQQNFFANKGYLPKNFQSDLGQSYYRAQPQAQQQQMNWNPYMDAYSHMFGGGGSPFGSSWF
jgi:hypothetical protein